MNMSNWEDAVIHGQKTLELYPLFARDEDFMDGLSHSLKQLGDKETADNLEEYFYGFAMQQKWRFHGVAKMTIASPMQQKWRLYRHKILSKKLDFMNIN